MSSSMNDRPPQQQKQRGYVLPPRKRQRTIVVNSTNQAVKEEQIAQLELKFVVDGSFRSLQHLSSELDATAVLSPDLINRSQYAATQTLQRGHNVSLEEARLVAHMLKRLAEYGVALSPRLFASTLKALAKSSRGTFDAENFLDFMASRRDREQPPTDLFNLVIVALVKSNENGSTMRAERLLRQLEDEFERTGNEFRKPDLCSYGSVVRGYARDRQPDRAAAMLKELERLFRQGDSGLIPHVGDYSIVIDSYCRLDSPDAADKVQALVEDLLALHRDHPREEVRPNPRLFSIAIDGLSKSTRQDRADRVAKLVGLMDEYQVECDLPVYNTVINVFATIGTAKSAAEAETLLSSLESHPTLQPNHYTYNAVIRVYSKLSGTGVKSENVLRRWISKCQSGVVKRMPDFQSYSTVINCWAGHCCREGAERAEEILAWMERDKRPPTSNCYANVIRAWAHSGEHNCGERAQRVFDRIPQPNHFCYVTLINAHARNGDLHSATTAEKLLREAFARGLRPQIKHCNSILSAYGRGQDESGQGGIRAEAMLDWMDSVGVKCDVISMNSVIKAHANSNHPDRAKRALGMMRRISDPTSITYSIMIKALAGHTSLLEELFTDCTSRGLVDEMLVGSFRCCGVRSIVLQLEKAPLPSEWCRHVRRLTGFASRKHFLTNHFMIGREAPSK